MQRLLHIRDTNNPYRIDLRVGALANRPLSARLQLHRQPGKFRRVGVLRVRDRRRPARLQHQYHRLLRTRVLERLCNRHHHRHRCCTPDCHHSAPKRPRLFCRKPLAGQWRRKKTPALLPGCCPSTSPFSITLRPKISRSSLPMRPTIDKLAPANFLWTQINRSSTSHQPS